MNRAEQKWYREGATITNRVYVCDCSGDLRFVGTCPCIHEDGYAYLYQCVLCKNVEIGDYRPYHDEGELKSAGWVLKETIKV